MFKDTLILFFTIVAGTVPIGVIATLLLFIARNLRQDTKDLRTEQRAHFDAQDAKFKTLFEKTEGIKLDVTRLQERSLTKDECDAIRKECGWNQYSQTMDKRVDAIEQYVTELQEVQA